MPIVALGCVRSPICDRAHDPCIVALGCEPERYNPLQMVAVVPTELLGAVALFMLPSPRIDLII